MTLREKAQLMTASEIDRTLVHLAHEIVEKTSGLESLALVGIRRRGVPLAERLARKIREISSITVPVGTLDIQLYRDDLSPVDSKPVVQPSQIPFSVNGKDVILVDDVLYTGRTSRAALDARVLEVAGRYAGGDIPRPPDWGGYRVSLDRIEFWQGRDARLHDRIAYTRNEQGGWSVQRLYP